MVGSTYLELTLTLHCHKNSKIYLILLFVSYPIIFRRLPIDMAGFAIHLRKFLEHPRVYFGVDLHGHISKTGYLETDLLSHFATRESVECRGSNTEVIGIKH